MKLLKEGESMLTNRARDILILMISQTEEMLTIKHLSEKFNVSTRSIRNDLEIIDDFLDNHQLGQIEKETLTIISLPPIFREKGIDYTKLTHLIDSSYLYFSLEERLELIFIEVLFNPRSIRIDDMTKVLQVSRSTVVSDINEIKNILRAEQIEFKTDNQNGYYLEGRENNIRKYGLMLLSQNPYLRYRVEESIQNGSWGDLTFYHIEFLERVIYEVESKLNISFSGNAFSNILYGMLIMIFRAEQKDSVTEVVNYYDKSHLENIEYSILLTYVETIEEKFDISISKKEVWYLVNLFQEGNLIESDGYLDKNWVDLFLFANHFIDEISQEIGVQLSQDPDLFKALVLHLGPALNRIRNDTYLKNEIVDYIKDSYSDLFSLVQTTLNKLSKNKGLIFNLDEIGFITLHVASALEKISSVCKMKIVIVCNHGIGTSKLLKNRIENHLSFNVLKTLTSREVTSEFLKDNEVDLIISTIPLEENSEVPIEIISPLLSDEEILKLKKIEVNHPFLQEKHKNTISNLVKGDEPMLEDLLTENVIDVNVSVNDWEEAVRYGGKLLKEKGVIEQTYIESMVDTVKELGPYIVIAPRIAMPHASSKDGVNEIGISLITLSDPIEFGNEENDPVKIVVTLATVDHSTHLKALGELVGYLNNDVFISKILQADTVEEVIEILNLKK